MRKSVFLVCLAGFIFFSVSSAFGNDGSYTKIEGSLTGAAMPINNEAISMVSENIEINIERVDFDFEWLGIRSSRGAGTVRGGRVVTKCSFTFRNETGIRQKVLIGYPVTNPVEIFDQGNRNYTQRNELKDPDIVFFEARVRGNFAPVEYVTHENNPALPAVGPYQGVYLFTVSFDKNETVLISNTIVQNFNWSFALPSHRYILSTGTTWKKPIGHSRITVHFSDVPAEGLYFRSLSFEPSNINGTTITYEFSDFIPNRDLDFQFDLKINRTEDIGRALRAYYASQKFKYINRITELLFYTSDFKLQRSGLDSDFLRRMYFDSGNYFHKRGLFREAAIMFRISFYFSSPVLDWLEKNKSVGVNNFVEYIKRASALVNIKEISKNPEYKFLSDANAPAPSYYSAYNWACAESRCFGWYEGPMALELALFLGYPKKEYDWIRKDPDLESLRTLEKKEFEALLKKYEEKK